jgi:integrase
MAKRLITSRAALTVKPGETHSEPVGGRGAGTLLLVGRERQVSAYYRYTSPDGKRPWIELGALGSRYGLEDARGQCVEYWQLRRQFPYLKEHIAEKANAEKERLEAEQRLREAELKSATLEELLHDYVTHLAEQGKVSARAIGKTLDTVVIESHPDLASKKAKLIDSANISEILTPLSKRGKKVYRNRVRSYLHAAFKFGLDREYDETRSSEKSFGLDNNPVSAIPALSGVDNVGTHSLDDPELRRLYLHVADVVSVGPIMAALIQFLIATAGQRPSQVLRVPWTDYDFKKNYFKIIDKKGRGSEPRVHVVPLSARAKAILLELKATTGDHEWPFSITGKAPISIQSLKNIARRFLSGEYGQGVEPFTVRDIRRTCKQVMTRAKIPREQRNLLQNHGQTGVDAKHYDNDPLAHLSTKEEAMGRYEHALENVLSGSITGNAISLRG